MFRQSPPYPWFYYRSPPLIPSKAAGGNLSVTIDVGAVTIAGQLVDTLLETTADVGSVTIAGQSVTAKIGEAVTGGAITIAGQSIADNIGVTIGTGAVTVAGQSVLVALGIGISTQGVITFAGQTVTPALNGPIAITIDFGGLTFDGQSVTASLTSSTSSGVGSSGGGGSLYKRATKLKEKPNKHLKKILEDVEDVYRELFDGDEPAEVAALIEPIVAAVKDPESIDWQQLEAQADAVRKKLRAWAAAERQKQSDADDEWFLTSD